MSDKKSRMKVYRNRLNYLVSDFEMKLFETYCTRYSINKSALIRNFMHSEIKKNCPGLYDEVQKAIDVINNSK